MTVRSTATRLLLSAGLVGVTVAALGSSVLASFSGATGVDGAAATGSVALAPVATDGPGNRLPVAATDLAPGDTAQRAVTVRNDGTVALDPATIALTVSSGSPSPLTDPVDGLQVRIDACPVPWTESGTAPAYTYGCAGSVVEVLAPRPVLGVGLPLAGLDGAPGAANHLRITLTLPPTAPDASQGRAATLGWSFTGSQRTGAAR